MTVVDGAESCSGSLPARHDGEVAVYRTFADDQKYTHRGLLPGQKPRLVPLGRIHAVRGVAAATLCGRPIQELFEFGRSRHPYERFPMEVRCQTCNQLAGRPTQ